jgi:CRP-like cAMP-binding protein
MQVKFRLPPARTIAAMEQGLNSSVATDFATAHDRRLLERLLGAQAAFQALPRHDFSEVVAHSYLLELRRGAALARRAERIPGLMLLATGSAKLSLRRADGEEKVLRLMGPGDAFGLAATVLDRPCPVDVLALAPSVAAIVPPMPVHKAMERNAAFARGIARALAERFLELVGELEASVQHSSAQRLAGYLLSLAAGDGERLSHLPATKTTVAARLGVKKETLSRLLHALVARGLIEVQGRDIALLDRAGLAQVAKDGL